MSCCASCLRSTSMTSAGVIRWHSPVGNRCPGSGKPPRLPTNSTLSTSPPPRSPRSLQMKSEGLTQRQASLRPIVRVRIVKRIPKGVRYQCKMKLTSILESVVGNNDLATWDRLFQFPFWCLRQPHRHPRFRGPTPTSCIRDQLNENSPPVSLSQKSRKKKIQSKSDPLAMARLVSSKIESGDFKGAICVASSEETLASIDDETYEALCLKHPPRYPDSSNPLGRS